MGKIPSLLIVTLALAAAGPAAATAVYTYDLDAPGESDDGVRVTIELPAPLAGGLSAVDISASIASWSASEGGSTLDDLDAEILSAVVSTGPGGNIEQWLFHFRESDQSPQSAQDLLRSVRSARRSGFGSLLGCGAACTEIRTESGPAQSSTSAWTLTPVPEPTTAGLLVCGLALLAMRGRRRSI